MCNFYRLFIYRLPADYTLYPLSDIHNNITPPPTTTIIKVIIIIIIFIIMVTKCTSYLS